MTTKTNKIVSILSGFMAALLVAGVAVFAPQTADASVDRYGPVAVSGWASPGTLLRGQTGSAGISAPDLPGGRFDLWVDFFPEDPTAPWQPVVTSGLLDGSGNGNWGFVVPEAPANSLIVFDAYVFSEEDGDLWGYVRWTVGVEGFGGAAVEEVIFADDPFFSVATNTDVVDAGTDIFAWITDVPGTGVTVEVDIPGVGNLAGLEVAATNSIFVVTDADGFAQVRISVPAGTPTGEAFVTATNGFGDVLSTRFVVAGTGTTVQQARRAHPAAG